MKIVFIPEMENFEEISNTESRLNPSSEKPVFIDFQKIWQDSISSISVEIDEKPILRISRWAKKEMSGFHFPKNWIRQVSLKPWTTLKNQAIFFFHEVENGIPLPSHSPIVFRRLMIGAVFDPGTSKITKVIVTIRGWREE